MNKDLFAQIQCYQFQITSEHEIICMKKFVNLLKSKELFDKKYLLLSLLD